MIFVIIVYINYIVSLNYLNYSILNYVSYNIFYDQKKKYNKNTSFTNKQMIKNSMIICVTGAAGQIAYSFLPQLLRGNAFPNVHIKLRLLDIP